MLAKPRPTTTEAWSYLTTSRAQANFVWNESASMSVDHEGFALSEQDARKMSSFHRLTRRGMGVKILFFYTLLTIILPAIYIAPTAVLLGYLYIVKPRNIQRFLEWGCGHWLHQMVVRCDGCVNAHSYHPSYSTTHTYGHAWTPSVYSRYNVYGHIAYCRLLVAGVCVSLCML